MLKKKKYSDLFEISHESRRHYKNTVEIYENEKKYDKVKFGVIKRTSLSEKNRENISLKC